MISADPSPTRLDQLPDGLPAPVKDNGCDHLPGRKLPALRLLSTAGGRIELTALPDPVGVLFFFPMTEQPGVPLPDGWDMIPGARAARRRIARSATSTARFAISTSASTGSARKHPLIRRKWRRAFTCPTPC